MSDSRYGFGIRRAGLRRFALTILVAVLGTIVVGQAAAADESPVPEDIAAYFATGLIPRLADLYGSPGSNDPAATFDDTTKVGTIHRLLAWTPAFLAGKKTDNPTELTNTWIAPVTAKAGTILGLAAVWINPGSNIVELADFSRGRALVDALGHAPKDTLLIDDAAQQAWFATDGKTLTPLVTGTSGVSGPLTPAEYQKILRAHAVPSKAPEPTINPGLLIAGVTLGGVVLLLAIFVLLPARKRKDSKVRDAAVATLEPSRPLVPGDESAALTPAEKPVQLEPPEKPSTKPAPAPRKPSASTTATPEVAPRSVVPALVVDDDPVPAKAPTKRAPTPRKPAATVTPKSGTSSVASSKSATPKSATPRNAAAPKTIGKAAPKATPKKAAPKTPPKPPRK